MESRRGLACASVVFVLGIGVGACRSDGSETGNRADGSAEGGLAEADFFEWTQDGRTTAATMKTYHVGATLDGSLFTVTIQGVAPLGVTCFLSGQFATAVPPVAGTYPIAPTLDGTREVPLPDGAFGLACQPSTIPDGGFVLDPGVSGQVVLTSSGDGRLAGTFTAEAAQLRISGSPTTSFTGRFSVHCSEEHASNAACGPFSVSAVGTCADLLACCAAADPTLRDGCMFDHSNVSSGGDVACGRWLAVSKSFYCP
jgi:hypothetical protein